MNSKLFQLLLVTAFMLLLTMTARAESFTAYLNGAQQVPAVGTNAYGYGRIVLDESAGTISYVVVYVNLTGGQSGGTINIGELGVNGPAEIGLGLIGGTTSTLVGTKPITPANIAHLRAHRLYINIESLGFPTGEIRGQLGINRPLDFDGDGRTDPSVRRIPAGCDISIEFCSTTYHNLRSRDGFQTMNWGLNSDIVTPGDYDGDGKDDFAVYRPGAQGVFYVFRSSDITFQVVPFGISGDQPVPRDYDGDGKHDYAVYRQGPGASDPAVWYILQSTNNQLRSVPWGKTGSQSGGDLPVPGDYDGDGKFDIAVYRVGNLSPSSTFLVLKSSDNTLLAQQWGDYTSDHVVPGDYDGDGKTDFAVVRRNSVNPNSPLVWYILQSSTGTLKAVHWGLFGSFPNDLTVQGDYDGDGRTDIAVYRFGSGGNPNFFYILRSSDNGLQGVEWGLPGDTVNNAFDHH